MTQVSKRPGKYHTRQSQAILSYIASLEGAHITAGQIASHFEARERPIGLATIYRHLERLVEDGKLRKYTLDAASGACYQYLPHDQGCECVHLKCEVCGAVLHLQCSFMENMPRHLFEAHAFRVNPMKTVLYGRCAKCLQE